MADIDAILIAGPTASGKSALAIDVATHHGGIIINADSMQVYQDLCILTARPTPSEEAQAPHSLYGHIDGAAPYSVGHWLAEAEAAIAAALAEDRLPVFVGGTGLYFKGLLEGVSPIPDIPDAIRTKWRRRGEGEDISQLHRELMARDPKTAATLRSTDSQRIVRALEVFEATGRPLVDWQAEKGHPFLDVERVERVFLDPDRDWLYDRINRRFDRMIAEGALDEVETLMKRDLPPDQPILRAHGVPHLSRYLSGELDLATALERGKADVRHYAKRQKTWFRHQMEGWRAVEPATARQSLRLSPTT